MCTWLAEVEMKIHGQSIKVKAAVSDNLPMGVLLGTDVPKLNDLLHGEEFTEE